MLSLRYPAILKREPDGTGFYVRFPDIPEALTSGKNIPEALGEAADCLAEALAVRMMRKEPIPEPSPLKKRQHAVSVPLDIAPKVALYVTMRERGINKSQLARRLGVSETVIRRMLDPKHESRPDRIQAALDALGKNVTVSVDDAA